MQRAVPHWLALGLRKLRAWPLPAILAWGLAWGLFRALLLGEVPVVIALGLASALGVGFSLWGGTWWRRLLIGAGFPLSLALSAPAGLGALPAWAWLLPLALLLLIYPVHAWRDAPLFPTPADALEALAQHVPLPDGAQVLDAGCGAGDGLRALHSAYPQAQCHGLEFSWPLRWLCALRCPWARVRQGDIWLTDWAVYDLVYVFQRPESMTRALLKAAEMRPGSWLVSLDFEAQDAHPHAHYRSPSGKNVWIYQNPIRMR